MRLGCVARGRPARVGPGRRRVRGLCGYLRRGRGDGAVSVERRQYAKAHEVEGWRDSAEEAIRLRATLATIAALIGACGPPDGANGYAMCPCDSGSDRPRSPPHSP